jgi:hypothetical protein
MIPRDVLLVESLEHAATAIAIVPMPSARESEREEPAMPASMRRGGTSDDGSRVSHWAAAHVDECTMYL